MRFDSSSEMLGFMVTRIAIGKGIEVCYQPDRMPGILEFPMIAPTWCMEIQYKLQSAGGKLVRGKIHNTIHKLK